MADDEVLAPDGTGKPPAPTRRHWYRLALGVTVALLALVLVLLPMAIQSMWDVLGRGPDPLYDFQTGRPVSEAEAAAGQQELAYLNLGIVDLDEGAGTVTIAVSGNAGCDPVCPQAVDLTLVALDDNPDERRGLPPSASLRLKSDQIAFSESVVLPVMGQPSLYPFDVYRLRLGIAGTVTDPEGQKVPLTAETAAGRGFFTLQNRIPDMIMEPPTQVAAATSRARTDPFEYLAVEDLAIGRPAYLKVLAVSLTLLIAVSAGLALFRRGIDELALGFGGLILGVWGIRSILMPQSIGTVTAVDLALSWLILLLLLGLALRTAMHFLRQGEVPLPTRRPRG